MFFVSFADEIQLITKSTEKLQLFRLSKALTVEESLRTVCRFRNLLPGKSEFRVTAMLVTTAETSINIDLLLSCSQYYFFLLCS
ncbi:hypothetical protein BH11BAC1_BH11BAC1_17160 [soil metagenome]